jgi:osmotically-inducible protein OsmY
VSVRRRASPPVRALALLWVLLPAALAGSAAADQGLVVDVDADARLEARIEQRLAWDRDLAPYALEVEVNEGIARLSGVVSTPSEDHRARSMAEEVSGVTGVVNALRVDSALVPLSDTPGEHLDDATLRERVRESLSGDGQVESRALEVRVERGRVTLEGRVGDVAQKARAEYIAGSLYGVQGVANAIEVAPASRQEDFR